MTDVGNEKLIIRLAGKLNAIRQSVLSKKKTVPADTTKALDSKRHELTSAACHSKRTGSLMFVGPCIIDTII